MGLKIALLCESFSEMAKAQGEFEPNLVHADSLFSVLWNFSFAANFFFLPEMGASDFKTNLQP